jgi:mRNA interferase RelE/StbE
MGRYQLRIKKSAEKELAKLPVHIILQIKEDVLALSNNPFPANYKKLKGHSNLYRIRSGDYRIIYTIHQDILTIEILKIGHRKDVYK